MECASRAGERAPRAVVERHMRRWETLTALTAVIAASLGALPVPGHYVLTLVGVALVLVVAFSRLREMLKGVTHKPPSDAAERAARIREERERRLGR